MTEVVNLSFVFVGGEGPAGISGAHFLSKNYGEESVHVLTKEKGGNALLSNEYFRLLLHADSPRILANNCWFRLDILWISTS